MVRLNFKLNLQLGTGKCLAFELSSSKPKTMRKDKIPERRLRKKTAMLWESGTLLARKVRPSTSKNYLTAMRSYLRFCGSNDISLSHITQESIEEYERWLLTQDVCMNTASCYMRSLRAIYNKSAGSSSGSHHPFANVFTGNDDTEKRSLTERDIRAISRLELPPGSPIALSRDMFLFSIYCLGMPYVDIAYLRPSQIQQDTIVYHRHKTKQRISIYIEPVIAEIIERYHTPGSRYVFPLIRSSDEASAYLEYRSQLSYHNRLLKKIGRMAGIKKPLTSYQARHTWASVAYSNNVDLHIIAKALGHTSPDTTLIYLKGINDDRQHAANKKLLKVFSQLPLRKRCKKQT